MPEEETDDEFHFRLIAGFSTTCQLTHASPRATGKVSKNNTTGELIVGRKYRTSSCWTGNAYR